MLFLTCACEEFTMTATSIINVTSVPGKYRVLQ
ncbi:uncharacterized protein METZ01_LOCUS337678, partial [marine metagenome]